MFTCFAIGSTLFSALLVAGLCGSLSCIRDGVRENNDGKIGRHALFVFFLLAFVTLFSGLAVALWHKALA